LRQNYVFNNKIIDLEDTLFNNIFNSYGLKYKSLKIIEQRIENLPDSILLDLNKNEWEHFINLIYGIVPYKTNIFKRKSFNIFMADVITLYRGWRHFKGLPVRGQRTWSNAWSAYKANWTLRNFKLNNAKKFYGNIPEKEINVAHIAEQVNMLWKDQWEQEWISAKHSILKFKGHPNTMKIDLYSMANYQVMHPLKLKNLSKKQKSSYKKNYFSLGFDPGFTKSLLNHLHNIDSDENSNSSHLLGSSLVLRDERLNKKKKN
jgi:ribosomal protein S13